MSFVVKVLVPLLFLANLYANPYKQEKVRSSLIQKFKEFYPSMTINHLYISPLSSKPREFQKYKMEAIYIPKSSLKHYKGTFSILYTFGTKERKLYYHYLLDATIPLYKSSEHIKRGEIIDESNTIYEDIPFKRVTHTPINRRYFNKYMARRDIQSDKIIYIKDLQIIPDIKRGESINTILRENGIEASFSTTAMQDGIVGDIIRVKKDNKKIFKAKIIQKDLVEILE